MNEPHGNHERMAAAVQMRQERRSRGMRERSLGQNLALIGALGWAVVLPTLVGVAAGRWLDRHYDAGVFWTLGLLVAGLALGCAMAWKRMHSE
jgi:ATP synthase protein I